MWPMEHAKSTLIEAEVVASRSSDIDAALNALRALAFDDFVEALMFMPSAQFPSLARILPTMAEPVVQRSWTGNDGYILLKETIAFVRGVNEAFYRHLGRSLENATVLDFGCGWGRILRAMLYYSSPKRLFGCDPLEISLEECRKCNLPAQLALSDFLPTSLPFQLQSFDLIYCFSVFTHTSERATAAALNTLRRYIKDSGLLVMTIRPIEYWDLLIPEQQQTIGVEAKRQSHRARGFAFAPHNRVPIDGDVTYGDTSMTSVFLRQFTGWEIVKMDHNLQDPFQLIVIMRPR